MKKLLSAAVLMGAIWGTAFGAPVERLLVASINGRGGDGRCTIEVNVDGEAIVEIRGDRGRLVTVAGAPSEWRRFQCNQRLPQFPNDFRFTGVDGRGRQQLMRDPAGNGGVAVIRIEDPQGGREGYTFDIDWRGGSDTPPYREGDRGRDREGDRGRDREGDRGRDRDQRNTFTVNCISNDGYRHYCEVDTRQGVRLLRQLGGPECREGSTWGYDRRGIWVDRGCRADFEVRR